MSKKIYICIIAVLVCLLLITGIYTIIHYYFNYDAVEWFRESIGDGDFLIVGEEIGNPFFGDERDVEIHIFDYINNDLMTSSFKTRIANNGEKLTSDNYKIEYNEKYIKIVLIDSDKHTSAYTFFFEDFN